MLFAAPGRRHIRRDTVVPHARAWEAWLLRCAWPSLGLIRSLATKASEEEGFPEIRHCCIFYRVFRAMSDHHHSCPSTRSRICQSNCALPMPGTADGDVVSRCQVLGRVGSAHHGAEQLVLHGLPDATVTGFWFVGRGTCSWWMVVAGFANIWFPGPRRGRACYDPLCPIMLQNKWRALKGNYRGGTSV